MLANESYDSLRSYLRRRITPEMAREIRVNRNRAGLWMAQKCLDVPRCRPNMDEGEPAAGGRPGRPRKDEQAEPLAEVRMRAVEAAAELALPLPLSLCVPKVRTFHHPEQIEMHVSPSMAAAPFWVPLGNGVYVASPELCLVQLATRLGEVQLLKLADEFCGLFSLGIRPESNTRAWQQNPKVRALIPAGPATFEVVEQKRVAEKRAEYERLGLVYPGGAGCDGEGVGCEQGRDGEGAACGHGAGSRRPEPLRVEATGYAKRMPLMDVGALARCVKGLRGCRGTVSVAALIPHVVERCATQREMAMALIIGAPTRLGGYGLVGFCMNMPVRKRPLEKPDPLFQSKHDYMVEHRLVKKRVMGGDTFMEKPPHRKRPDSSFYFCDMMFADEKVAVEFVYDDSEYPEEPDKLGKREVKRAYLKTKGIEQFVLTSTQLKDIDRMDVFARGLARGLKRRLRVSRADYRRRQERLRAQIDCDEI